VLWKNLGKINRLKSSNGCLSLFQLHFSFSYRSCILSTLQGLNFTPLKLFFIVFQFVLSVLHSVKLNSKLLGLNFGHRIIFCIKWLIVITRKCKWVFSSATTNVGDGYHHGTSLFNILLIFLSCFFNLFNCSFFLLTYTVRFWTVLLAILNMCVWYFNSMHWLFLSFFVFIFILCCFALRVNNSLKCLS
jgi:hypothetical protein